MNTIIVLPAYNVVSKISHTLKALLPYKNRTIVVDDGSVDGTYNVVKEYGFMCLRNEDNMGVSDAIRRGLLYAKEHLYDAAIILDSDGQHNPDSIPEFEYLLETSDLIVGNRFHSVSHVPSSKLASNAIAVMIFNLIFNCTLKDITCGYRAFHLDQWIYDVIKQSHGYSFIFDVLVQALLERKKVSGVDIECIYHQDELQYTKDQEIISFICCLKRYKLLEDHLMHRIDLLYDDIVCHRDFSFEIHELIFYGFYVGRYEGYIVQTDLKKLHHHWDCMM